MMTAIRIVKTAARLVSIAAGLIAAWQLVGADWWLGANMVVVSVAMAYIGWVLIPAQEDTQRILDRLHELDRPRQKNDNYRWEQK